MTVPGLPRFPKVDKRLLGTWKSDKKRTLKEWVWKEGVSQQKKRRFAKIFGELEVTYTRTKVILAKKETGWLSERRYIVVAADDESVAIAQYGKMVIKDRWRYDPENLEAVEKIFPPRQKISHIHFERRHYWVSLGNGRNREFFKKI